MDTQNLTNATTTNVTTTATTCDNQQPSPSFTSTLTTISSYPFRITTSRNKPILEQTKRNQFRQELLNGLCLELEKLLSFEGSPISVFRIKEGIALEIQNDAILAQEQASELSETTNGTISIICDLSFQNLEFDSYDASLEFEAKQPK